MNKDNKLTDDMLEGVNGGAIYSWYDPENDMTNYDVVDDASGTMMQRFENRRMAEKFAKGKNISTKEISREEMAKLLKKNKGK